MQPLDAFLRDCQIRRLSQRTIQTYKLRITPAIEVISGTDPRLSFMQWLDQYQNARTRHQAFRCVKTFVRWCASNGIGQDWITGIRAKFAEAPIPLPLTRDEVMHIIAAIPISGKRKDRVLVGRRDRTLFLVLYFTGARRDAVRLLKWADVDFSCMQIKIKTKGEKEFLLPLARDAARELNLWRVKCPSNEWVFPSITRTDRPVCNYQVTHALPRYAKKAGIARRVWVHLLRHSHAGAMAQAGIPADVIQLDLGHSDLKTTMKYIHKLNGAERVRNAINQVFG